MCVNMATYVLTLMCLLLYTQHWRKLLFANCDFFLFLFVFKQFRARTKVYFLRAHSSLCTLLTEDLNSLPRTMLAPCHKCSFMIFTSVSSMGLLSHLKLL